jgi:hypothetical protein
MFGDLSSPPGGIKGSLCVKNPNSPFKPLNLNTHKEIWDQNEIVLILDVWWFNNPAPVELRDPPAWKPQFHLQTLEF